MSAYMVNRETIDLLVRVAWLGPRRGSTRGAGWFPPYMEQESMNERHLDAVGEMLVKENLSSIHARYPDTFIDPDSTPGPIARYWDTPYAWVDPDYDMTPIEALKAIQCYEYQACEHGEWKNSEAQQFCEVLRHSLIATLDGYEAAPWGWDDSDLAAAKQRDFNAAR